MRKLPTACLILFSVSSHADPKPWMQGPNPNVLSIVTQADSGCPFSDKKLKQTVQDVLIRSRLKPKDWPGNEDPFGLSVTVVCLKTATDGYAYSSEVQFINVLDGHTVMYPEYPLHVGTAPDDWRTLLNTVEDKVQRAVSDYLQANFDLAPE